MFLLGILSTFAAMAPETNSDAVRFYWPYMRLLRHYPAFLMDDSMDLHHSSGGVDLCAAALSLLGTRR